MICGLLSGRINSKAALKISTAGISAKEVETEQDGDLGGRWPVRR